MTAALGVSVSGSAQQLVNAIASGLADAFRHAWVCGDVTTFAGADTIALVFAALQAYVPNFATALESAQVIVHEMVCRVEPPAHLRPNRMF